MSQANSLIEGGTAAAALIGPALAGILIPLLGAPNVLYIDAGTYLVAFLLVLLSCQGRSLWARRQAAGCSRACASSPAIRLWARSSS